MGDLLAGIIMILIAVAIVAAVLGIIWILFSGILFLQAIVGLIIFLVFAHALGRSSR